MKKFPGRSAAFLVFALLGHQSVHAQVGTPNLGAIFDPETSQIRSVPGIPGLARIGAPIELETPIEAAAYSPDRDYVLAAPASMNGIVIIDGSGPRTIAALDSFSRVALSPSGEYAALVDATGRRLVVVSGLPGNPEFVIRTWFPSYYGTPGAIAISDEGLVLTSYTGSGAVLSLDAGTPTRRPGFLLWNSFGSVSAMAFVAGRQDALIADDAVDAVYLVREIDGNSVRSIVADRSDGIDQPVAVSASEDGTRFFVADAGAAAVFIASESRPAIAVPCACTPEALTPLQGSSVFALTAPGNDAPVWVINAGMEPAAVNLAPATVAVEE